MRIALHHQALRLGTYFVAAELPPGDEELLCRRQAVDYRGGPGLLRFLKCQPGDLRAGEVADRFAEYKSAVVMDAGLDEVAVELIRHARRPLLKTFEIFGGPPVPQASLRVILRALIVETVADLVSDHDADRAVVHRVGGVDVEGGRYQDSGGKDDLVEQRVVVRVRRRRRHAPSSAVGRFADPLEVVGRTELQSGHNVLPMR